ncbi:MAG TPA: type I secretion system permease/ATPase [Burkholderiales bacterium]|nr:type I secretion system permease/ATPase [Burkholderiales bacterium]
MRQLLARFRPFFFYAGLFSLFINLLLLVPVLYMLQIFDRVIASRSDETLVVLTVGAILALGVGMVLDMLRGRLLASAGVALDKRLGPPVLAGLLDHARGPGGAEYVSGLRDVGTLRTFLTGTGIFALFDAPWLPIFIIVIFLFHPILGLIASVGSAILLSLAYLNEKLTRRALEDLQANGRKAGRFIDLSVRNAEVVGAHGMVQNVTSYWEHLNRRVLKAQVRASRAGGSISGLTKFTRQLIQIAMLGTGAWLVIDLHVTAGVMLAATILLGRALAPVESIIAGWKSLVEARSAYLRLDKLLGAHAADRTPTELPVPEGALYVERVAFGIRGHEKAIIRGVSFEVAAGESLGIIGPSAAGKSTLARLILGVWKPVNGVVRLDGADIAEWPRDKLGPHLGYLPQDVELFSGTAAENIARMGAVDSDAVVTAAKRANAHELILRLPNGYDTQIGDGGTTLSGGQRQRLALARALYRNPRLIVLDEPNANLDSEGEDALMRAMLRLKQEKVTLIVITHRPSLLANVDKILVLREGQAEMFGPRAEIIARVTRGSVQAITPVVAAQVLPRAGG